MGVNLLQSINKFQQAEKKINNEGGKKKMDGCLNEDHVEYATWILSSEFHTLYKGVEKVLTKLRICRHAFAFNARKCVKYFSSSLQSKLYD